MSCKNHSHKHSQKCSCSQKTDYCFHDLCVNNKIKTNKLLVKEKASIKDLTAKNLKVKESVETCGILLNEKKTPCVEHNDEKGLLWLKENDGTANFLVLNNDGHTFNIEKTPEDPLHGWWQAVTRGNFTSFNNAGTSDIDCYIFIDVTTVPYISLKTLAGTCKFPREQTVLDALAVQQLFVKQSDTELISITDVNGPTPSPTYPSSYSLKLQSDNIHLLACSQSQPSLTSEEMYAVLFKKIDSPPVPIRPFNDVADSVFPSANDPVKLARYWFDSCLFSNNQQNNKNFNNTDYVGYKKAIDIFNQMCSPSGITFTTPITQIRVSIPGPHFHLYGTFTDVLTDIFTGIINNYSTAGSTVTISGFDATNGFDTF